MEVETIMKIKHLVIIIILLWVVVTLWGAVAKTTCQEDYAEGGMPLGCTSETYGKVCDDKGNKCAPYIGTWRGHTVVRCGCGNQGQIINELELF